MSFIQFLKYTFFASAISILCFCLLNELLDLREHFILLWWSIGLFVILGILAFGVAWWSIKKNKGKQFIGIVIFNVFIKLVASFALVGLYVKLHQPQHKDFIIPFLITYLTFTVLETYFLSVQARQVR